MNQRHVLLHLTDLHLLGEVDDDNLVDVKGSDLVEFVQRSASVEATIDGLLRQIQSGSDAVSSIVVSGDITNRCALSGFKRFATFVDRLTAEFGLLPEQFVVVPGNHDVPLGALASSNARYERFVQFVRDIGCVTPMLEGVDTIENLSVEGHVRIDRRAEVVIVPVNSANYCHIPDSSTGSTVDMARVSPSQLEGIQRLIRLLPDDTRDFTRIMVLHHPLAAVGVFEEVKPYETLTNLGYVRQVFAEQGASVVLHGHKHREWISWESLRPRLLADPLPQAALVVGGSTATQGGGDVTSDAVVRVLRFVGTPQARTADISEVKTVQAGLGVNEGPVLTGYLWDPSAGTTLEGSAPTTVRGQNRDQVYERILRLADNDVVKVHGIHNLVTHVRDSASCLSLPPAYPTGETAPDVGRMRDNEWFTEMVDWWQQDRTRLQRRVLFTHGSRIANWNQLGRAVKSLRTASHRSGRTIVSLLNPESDAIDEVTSRFPSLINVQFELHRKTTGTVVHATAYFRKQELVQWWPVNMAEVAQLLDRVAKETEARAGSITSIACFGHVGWGPSLVGVPLLDRRLDSEDGRDFYQGVALAVAGAAVPERASLLAEWLESLEEIRPPEARPIGDFPVAIDGLRYLAHQVDRASRLFGSTDLTEDIRRCLTSMADQNQAIEELMQKREVDDLAFDRWKREVTTDLRRLRSLISGIATA